MSLKDAIRASAKTTKRKEPLWKGPEVDGITFSLLSRFLVCRERFRCLVVEGLRPADSFNHRIEFGQMWHVCEESLASEISHFGEINHFGEWVGTTVIDDKLKEYVQGLFKKYPTQRDLIVHWSNVVSTLFSIYIGYWAKNPDVTARTPLFQEQVFDVPYSLPSGRKIRLRGKWDAVDLIGKGKDAGVYLQENKTKSDINEQQIRRQLSFDLQTMIYLVALHESMKSAPGGKGIEIIDIFSKDGRKAKVPGSGAEDKIKGVRYNVIKRPLHRQGKKETPQEFLDRLASIVSENPGDFFMRWKVEISAADVVKFRRECLDPILEQVCDWYEYMTTGKSSWASAGASIHWRHPFGVYNVLDEGGSSDLDEYLTTGSEVGLKRADKLFNELE